MVEWLDLRKIPAQQAQEIINRTLRQQQVEELNALVDDDQIADGLAQKLSGTDYQIQTGEQGGDYYLNIHKGFAKPQLGQEVSYVVLVGSLSLGQGDKDQGHKLLINLLKSMAQVDITPSHLILINEAVTMAVAHSAQLPVVEQLRAIGCEIMVCTDSLEYYAQRSQLAIGYAVSSLHIAALLAQAGKVVTL